MIFLETHLSVKAAPPQRTKASGMVRAGRDVFPFVIGSFPKEKFHAPSMEHTAFIALDLVGAFPYTDTFPGALPPSGTT